MATVLQNKVEINNESVTEVTPTNKYIEIKAFTKDVETLKNIWNESVKRVYEKLSDQFPEKFKDETFENFKKKIEADELKFTIEDKKEKKEKVEKKEKKILKKIKLKINNWNWAQSIEELKHFKVKELKDILTHLKKSTKGKKEELLEQVFNETDFCKKNEKKDDIVEEKDDTVEEKDDTVEETKTNLSNQENIEDTVNIVEDTVTDNFDEKTDEDKVKVNEPEIEKIMNDSDEIEINPIDNEKKLTLEYIENNLEKMFVGKFDDKIKIVNENEQDETLNCLNFKEKNWVFQEEEDSFGFLGILKEDTIEECDPPDELLNIAF
tara:strand:+ start:99 stop:1067 length:969 start_codon:yes stop_codon:yes gene_type:complete